MRGTIIAGVCLLLAACGSVEIKKDELKGTSYSRMKLEHSTRTTEDDIDVSYARTIWEREWDRKNQQIRNELRLEVGGSST